MHRTFRLPWMLLGGVIALLLGLLPSQANAQLCSPAPEPRPLTVLINSTTRLQMSTRRPIDKVVNPKEGVLDIRTIEGDPTTIVLAGKEPGITRIELTDIDGKREYREVQVQIDVEYLTAQLRRALPLSNIQVIPNGRGVILSGYVFSAEEITLAERIALVALGLSSGRPQGATTGASQPGASPAGASPAGASPLVTLNLRLSGVQQVQLDVVIARVNRRKNREFGFNFLGNTQQSIYGSTIGDLIPIAARTIGVPSGALQPAGQFGTQTINAATGTATAFGGVIGNAAGFIGFLRALERENLAKVMAQPRLVTKSGHPAYFNDGGQQAVPEPQGLGTISVRFEPFGTSLQFVPLVLGNGRIHLSVNPRLSFLDPAVGTIIQGTAVAGRIEQEINTSVELESGQTFVLGGLIQRIERGNTAKTPLLGQLPFVGALFSTKDFEENETELVVLVTPHLVDAQSVCQVAKILPGQESRSPDDFELFLEGILEAPRGPRAVLHGNRYVPAHFNGPTAKLFPCAGAGDGMHSQPVSTGPGCASGNCGIPAANQLQTLAVPNQSVAAPVPPAGQPTLPTPATTPHTDAPASGTPQPVPATEGVPLNPVPGTTPGTLPPPPEEKQPAAPAAPAEETTPVSESPTPDQPQANPAQGQPAQPPVPGLPAAPPNNGAEQP